MRVCTIASGSGGNCLYLGTDSTHVLVDVGISCKKITESVRDLGVDSKEIDAVLLTHEHIDHVRSLGVIARKLGIPFYATKGTSDALKKDGRLGEIPGGLVRLVEPDRPFSVGDLNVTAFSTPHDAAEPVGFRFESGGKSFAVAMDLGTYDNNIVRHLKRLDGILLEANHDVRMLETGPYPYALKQRILSPTGHLSNEAAGKLLSGILHDTMRFILLGHLSKQNNYPALAYETVCSEVTFGDNPYKASDFKIDVAPAERPCELLKW